MFCIDWENRFFRASIIRCSKRIYGAATACACFISSMLVVLLGEWLFLFVLRIPYPFYLEQDAIAFGLDTSVFSIFMGEFEILGYFLFGTFGQSFLCGFLCHVLSVAIYENPQYFCSFDKSSYSVFFVGESGCDFEISKSIADFYCGKRPSFYSRQFLGNLALSSVLIRTIGVGIWNLFHK